MVDLLVSLIDGLMVAAAVDASDDASQEYRVQILRDAAQRLLREAVGRQQPVPI